MSDKEHHELKMIAERRGVTISSLIKQAVTRHQSAAGNADNELLVRILGCLLEIRDDLRNYGLTPLDPNL